MFGKEIDEFVKEFNLTFLGYIGGGERVSIPQNKTNTNKALIFGEPGEIKKNNLLIRPMVYIYGDNVEEGYKVKGYRMLQCSNGIMRHNTLTNFDGVEEYKEKRKINLMDHAGNFNEENDKVFLLGR